VERIRAVPGDAFVRAMRMSVVPTGVIRPGLAVVRTGTVNFYMVWAGDAVVAFDSGYGAAAIRRELARVGVRPDDVTHVFLSHSDIDHVGGSRLFRNARVYLSAAELPLATGQVSRALTIRTRAPRRDWGLLDDGDVVQVGSSYVRAISCPGHTPGSMSFLVDETQLFTGDALAVKQGRTFRGRRLYTMDFDERNRSVAKLIGIGASAIFTAHSGYYLDPARQIAPGDMTPRGRHS
jgi:hydroxyacylglutathione hydrolase